MTKEEFNIWFAQNLDRMAELGIYHYNSDKAVELYATMKVLYPEIQKLKEEIQVIKEMLPKKKTRKKEK